MRLHVLNAFVLVLGFLCVCPVYAFDLSLTTTVRPAPNRIVSVFAKIENWKKPDVSIYFEDRWGPAVGIYKSIKNLSVTNNGKAVELNFTEPNDPSGETPAVYAANVEAGTIEIRYDVMPADYSRFWDLGSVYSVIDYDHGIIKGASSYFSLNARSAEYEDIVQTFELPQGWEAHCPGIQVNSFTCKPELYGNPNAVSGAALRGATPVGNWQKQILTVQGMDLEILRAGKWSISYQDLLGLIQPPLVWQLKTMGGHVRSRYQVAVDTYPEDVQVEGHSSGGERLFDNIYIITERDIPLDLFFSMSLHVIVHEFFHTFDWDFAVEDPETMTWFNEGMTDLMSWMSLFETTVPMSAAADRLASVIEEYWNSPISKAISIREASINRWESPDRPWTQRQLDFILYSQVDLLGLFIINPKAPGLGLANMMGDLWQNYGLKHQPLSESDICQSAVRVLGQEIADLWWKGLSAKDPLPLKQSLTSMGWKVTSAKTGSLGVRFRKDMVVRGPDFTVTRDPSTAIPFKQGDRVLSIDGRFVQSVSDYWAMMQEQQPGETVSVLVERDGQRVDVQAIVRPYEKLLDLVPPSAR